MYQILSYPIKKGQPTWPGNPAFSLEPHTSIAGGDTANTCTIHLFNHYGTHLDGPMHFYGKGIPLDQVPFGQFFFHNPLLLDIPKEPGAKLMPEDLIPHREDVKDADLLLIRTGFSKYRREKPDLYENNGPAVSSRLARYLQDNMSHLKALALDLCPLPLTATQRMGIWPTRSCLACTTTVISASSRMLIWRDFRPAF